MPDINVLQYAAVLLYILKIASKQKGNKNEWKIDISNAFTDVHHQLQNIKWPDFLRPFFYYFYKNGIIATIHFGDASAMFCNSITERLYILQVHSQANYNEALKDIAYHLQWKWTRSFIGTRNSAMSGRNAFEEVIYVHRVPGTNTKIVFCGANPWIKTALRTVQLRYFIDFAEELPKCFFARENDAADDPTTLREELAVWVKNYATAIPPLPDHYPENFVNMHMGLACHSTWRMMRANATFVLNDVDNLLHEYRAALEYIEKT